jgi:MipA family protein
VIAKDVEVNWDNSRMIALRIMACLLLSAFATHLSAEEVADESLPGLWGIRLVAFGQNFPAYPSSSEQNLTILPIPYPVYRGKVFSFGQDLDEIANGQILSTNRINLSVGLNASFPESSDNLSARAGMPDLDFLVEAGPELNFALKGGPDDKRELLLSLQIRGAASIDGLDATGRGVAFNPELEYLVRDVFDSKTELRFRISPTWGTSDYTDFFYGVAPEYSTPDRPSYDAASGYVNTEFLLGLNRKITDRWEFRGSVRLWVNKGSANEFSPLYQRDYNHGIRLALFWTAWESKRRAATEN